jgi:hypothetical protein
MSDSANSVAQKSAKAGRCGKRTGCATIGTEIPSWRSNDCREMDEMEKAESPSFLSMGPVPDSQIAPLSNLDPSQKSATLRSDGGRSFAGFTRLVFAGSPRADCLWLESSWGFPNRRYFDSRIDAEVTVTMAHATGAKQNGLRDHSWEKRPSPRGRFRVLTAPRRSSCQRRDSRDIY